jgi:hypothetical protein
MEVVAGTYILRGVRCAAHTLQLAVDGVMKEGAIANLMGRSRKVAKKLRTPSIAVMAKKLHLKKAMLDCPTRWHSTLDMLLRLLELKEFCVDMARNELKELHLSQSDWDKIKEICAALLPAKIATKIMQEEQLVFGDFFKAWLRCKLETKSINTNFATALAAKMTIREALLLDNDAFLAAIFMDPRFQITLSAEKKERAICHLESTWARMENLLSQEIELETDIGDADADAEAIVTQELELDPLELMLQQQEDANSTTDITLPRSSQLSKRQIRPILENFKNSPRLDKNTSILAHWERNKNTCPKELYELGQIALAVPPTQVSVERLFSGLKYVLTHLRTNIKPELLEDILIIRTNELFKKSSDGRR